MPHAELFRRKVPDAGGDCEHDATSLTPHRSAALDALKPFSIIATLTLSGYHSLFVTSFSMPYSCSRKNINADTETPEPGSPMCIWFPKLLILLTCKEARAENRRVIARDSRAADQCLCTETASQNRPTENPALKIREVEVVKSGSHEFDHIWELRHAVDP
jgi:hypothetical protein